MGLQPPLFKQNPKSSTELWADKRHLVENVGGTLLARAAPQDTPESHVPRLYVSFPTVPWASQAN